MRILKRLFVSVLGVALFGLAATVNQAVAAYPDRPIRIIVPFEPGGANDIMARVTAPILTKVMGQPVIVENKPGGGGNIGAAFVATGAGDGYNILFTAGGATQNPALYKVLNYEPNDLAPVAVLGFGPHIFLVNPKFPFKGLRDFVAYARQNPGKLNAAAGGATTRLESEMFRLQNDIKLEIIPYNGTGRASTAVVAGESDFVIMDTSPVVSLIEAGQLRGLAIIGDARLGALPNIPTAKEQGFPDFLGGVTFGAYATTKTPRDILQKLNSALVEATHTPELSNWFDKVGAKPTRMNLEEAKAWYLNEIKVWKDVVAKANIPPLD